MRNVVVTGGSRGLGLGIVRRLTCEGYRAVAIARQMNDQLESAMEDIEQSRPGSLHFIPFDLGNIEQIPEMVRKLRELYPDAKRDLVNLQITYTAGVDSLEETLRELEQIFPRWYYRHWSETGDLRGSLGRRQRGSSGNENDDRREAEGHLVLHYGRVARAQRRRLLR